MELLSQYATNANIPDNGSVIFFATLSISILFLGYGYLKVERGLGSFIVFLLGLTIFIPCILILIVIFLVNIALGSLTY